MWRFNEIAIAQQPTSQPLLSFHFLLLSHVPNTLNSPFFLPSKHPFSFSQTSPNQTAMTDRVYPKSTAHPPQPLNGSAGTNSFPATKAQLYGATRPAYRPQPQRRSRSRCCSCCLWFTFVILSILVLAAIASAIFYVLYRPHRPSFAVTSLRISQFNVTATKLTSKLDLSITARNPNKKLVFIYDPTTVSAATSSSDVSVGTGTIPAFVHGTKNTTSFKVLISSTSETLDSSSITALKSDLKSKSLPLKFQLDTKVKVKVGGLKTNKVKIRVTCDGIKATIPAGKSPGKASTENVKCEVDIRVKVWKWTF